MEDLPEELIQQICFNLNYGDLNQLSLLSSSFKRICQEVTGKKVKEEILAYYEYNLPAFEDLIEDVTPNTELSVKMEQLWKDNLEPYTDLSDKDETLAIYIQKERLAILQLIDELSLRSLFILLGILKSKGLKPP